jgi:hypothetical protein
MTQSEQQRADAKAARAARKGAQSRKRLQNRRRTQREAAKSAIGILQASLQRVKTHERERKALEHHASGFYTEIDKLTKSKALLEVTPLMLDEVNEIIRNTKRLVEGDPHLDRIKEFVPAGNNPIYADVLVILRGVRQSLERGEETLRARERHIANVILRAETTVAALDCFIEADDPDAVVTKEDVQAKIDPLADACFWWDEESNGDYFDFDELDRRDNANLFSESTAAEPNSESNPLTEDEDTEEDTDDEEE